MHKEELKSLDNEILERMYDLDETEEACNEEANEASDIMEKVVYYLICLEGVLKEDQCNINVELEMIHRSISQESVRSSGSMSSKVSVSSRARSKVKSYVESQESNQVAEVAVTGTTMSRAKLMLVRPIPRQESRCRSKIAKNQPAKNFGEGGVLARILGLFKSAIHDSPSLAKVDRFKYLRPYLEEPMKKVIGGLSLTNADYDSAIQILKNRYARLAKIKWTHMSQLINLSAVYNEKNITKLQQLHDDIETNFRSLETLGVDHDSYSSIIILTSLEKFQSRLSAARTHFQWE